MTAAHFHNTVNVDDATLAAYNIKAKTQEERILRFFKQFPHSAFTPFEVQKALDLYHVPITSVRRAISNLTKDGFLTKCQAQKGGPYGKPNYLWKLTVSIPAEQTKLFADV